MPRFTITDHNGLKLAAVYHEPATSGNYPLVLMLRGFTGYKEEEHIVSLANSLAAAGIAALRFDAPGSGESEGSWAEDYRVTKYLDDISDVYEYAVQNLPVDPLRIAIWGHSMGGLVALTAACRLPNTFIAACGSQPSSGKKVLTPAEDSTWRIDGWFTFKSGHHGDIALPYAYLIDRSQYNLLAEIPQIGMPLLLIAGTTDKLVPAESVRLIAEAAPEPKQYLEYNTGHDYEKYPKMLKQINDATVDFFRVYLKP